MSKNLLFSVTKKDLEVQVFRAGGKGGQRQNKVSTGVRIIHKDSGAIGESRDQRSQYQNKKIAFKRLTESSKFKIWLSERVYEEINQISIEKEVRESMSSKNLLIEVKEENKWKEIK
jgi:protein subunit release factor A